MLQSQIVNPDQGSGTIQRLGSVLSKVVEKRLPELSEEEIAERQRACDEHERAMKEQERRRAIGERFDSFFGRGESRYRNVLIDDFKVSLPGQQAAVDAVREYIDTMPERIKEGNGIILYGPCGTGKDHLAIAVCREAMIRGLCWCGHVNGADWFGELRDQMGDGSGRSERGMVESLSSPTFLLLSDPLPPVGALTPYQASMLYRLIECRYWSGKPTIVTINVRDGKEAQERMGVAAWDRIKEGAWVIACDWPSYRKPARIINGK